MIYDVSIPIENGMPIWPSDPEVSLTPTEFPSRDNRHMIRYTTIEMGSHTGTHIDAPYHFVDGGRKLHEIPLQLLVGKVAVFHITGVRSINRRHLEQLDWLGIRRVLSESIPSPSTGLIPSTIRPIWCCCQRTWLFWKDST